MLLAPSQDRYGLDRVCIHLRQIKVRLPFILNSHILTLPMKFKMPSLILYIKLERVLICSRALENPF